MAAATRTSACDHVPLNHLNWHRSLTCGDGWWFASVRVIRLSTPPLQVISQSACDWRYHPAGKWMDSSASSNTALNSIIQDSISFDSRPNAGRSMALNRWRAVGVNAASVSWKKLKRLAIINRETDGRYGPPVTWWMSLILIADPLEITRKWVVAPGAFSTRGSHSNGVRKPAQIDADGQSWTTGSHQTQASDCRHLIQSTGWAPWRPAPIPS